MAVTVGNYLVSVEQLSNRNAPAKETNITAVVQSPLFQSLVPYAPYAPILLFILLFVCAFGIQIVTKARGARNIIVIFFISLFAASIPAVLTYVETGGGQETKAGPLEAPRELRVAKSGASSATVTWHTEAETAGTVRLSNVPFTLSRTRVYVADNGKILHDHTVVVPFLLSGTEYEFEVLSGKEWYDNNGRYIRFKYSL